MKKCLLSALVILPLLLAGTSASAKDLTGKKLLLQSTSCTAATAGKLRYANGCMQTCNGSSWTNRFGCRPTTQTVNCTSKPTEGSSYNDGGQITTTRNNTQWIPSTTAVYSEIGGGGSCTFKCDQGYTYDDYFNLCRHERMPCETEALTGAAAEYLAASGYTIASCNVGALSAGTGVDAYGYHYQWGNNFGFNARPGSTVPMTTLEDLVDASGYGPSTTTGYYKSNIFVRTNVTPYDWSNSQNNNLWGNNETEAERQGPCATGRHIPTHTEWKDLFTAYARYKGNDAYNGANVSPRPASLTMEDTVNDLLIPLAGYRHRESGVLLYQGGYAYYRASTPSGTNAYNLYFYSTHLSPQNSNHRAYGFSLRCFQNSH